MQCRNIEFGLLLYMGQFILTQSGQRPLTSFITGPLGTGIRLSAKRILHHLLDSLSTMQIHDKIARETSNYAPDQVKTEG